MTTIVWDALCGFGVKFALIFLIAPLCILLAGYLVYIAVQCMRELDRMDGQRHDGGKKE